MKNKFLTWLFLVASCVGVVAFCLCGVTGCATSGNSAAAAPEVAELVAQTVITNTVPAVLNRNPSYEAALLALVDGVDIVFAKGSLSAEDVNLYLDLIAGRNGLDPDTRLLLGSAILDLYGIYTKTAGVKVASTADPKFAALLNSFRDGVREGIRRYHVFKPSTAASK